MVDEEVPGYDCLLHNNNYLSPQLGPTDILSVLRHAYLLGSLLASWNVRGLA